MSAQPRGYEQGRGRTAGRTDFALAHVRDPHAAGQPPEEQFRAAFAELRRRLQAACATPDEIGRVTVFTPSRSQRPYINDPWLELFPTDNRPARRTTHLPLADGVLVELEAVGIRGAARTCLEIEGVRHKDPLPMGVLLGDHLYSSAIVPDVPGGQKALSGKEAIDQAFTNLQSLLAAAGGSERNVADVWVYLGRWDCHDDMVDRWVMAFPDEARRPTRKTFYYPLVEIQLQCEAVLGAEPCSLEIPGLSHRDPIPMGAVTGTLLTSSGVDGRDPATGRLPRGVAPQTRQALENVRVLLRQMSAAEADIGHVVCLLGQRRYLDEMQAEWGKFFDRNHVPPLQVMELGLPARDVVVQFIVRGHSPGKDRQGR